jgi:hypothetical protein
MLYTNKTSEQYEVYTYWRAEWLMRSQPREYRL